MVVVGAGPAGCATTLALCHLGMTVQLYAAPVSARPRIGESLTPEAVPALARLDLLSLLTEAPRLTGTRAYWGSDTAGDTTFMTSPYGEGWVLDRCRFDAALLSRARDAGARVVAHHVKFVKRRPEVWVVGDTAASHLVDATGRSASLARNLGASRHRVDRLVGVGAALEIRGDPPVPATLIESVPTGWWYLAPSDGHRCTVMIVTDADLVRNRYDGPQSWWASVQSTTHLSEVLSQARAERPRGRLITRLAATAVTQPLAGPRWLSVGDAALSTDPLASRGLPMALATGIAAAEAIYQNQEATSPSILNYAGRLGRVFAEYADTVAATYQREDRFPDRFWQRRLGGDRGSV